MLHRQINRGASLTWRQAGSSASIAAVALFSLVAIFALPEEAAAVTVTDQRPLLFSFNGHDTTAGRFTGVREIAIDEASEDIYVLSVAGKGQGTGTEQEFSKRVISKFNFSGEAQNFSSLGTSSLTGTETPKGAFGIEGFFESGSLFTDISVDNSCALHEPPLSGSACEAFDPGSGDLYVEEERGPLHIFSSTGHYECTLPRSTVETWGLTIDAAGHPWLVDNSNQKAREFANTGCSPGPPAQVGEFSLPAGNGSPRRAAVDVSGEDLYVADGPAFGTTPIIEKYVAGIPDSAVTAMSARDLTVDQSSAAGHIFAIGEREFREFEPCATPGCTSNKAPGSPFGGDLIGDGRGIAYNPVRDWVYVSDLSSGDVKVFGPPASGTTPDVTNQNTDGITKTEATAHGTINPLGVPNSYHFERIKGEAQHVSVEATGGSFRLSTGGSSASFTSQVPFNVSTAGLQAQLEALYGAGNVSVEGTPADGGVPGAYTVVFQHGLAGHDVEEMGGDASELTGGPQKVAIRTITQGQSWANAEPQPSFPEANPSIEPIDSADHQVSQQLTGLRPNTTYDVRLVGTSTEPEGDSKKRLNAYASPPNTFTTLPPPPPSVTGLSVPSSEVTPESAQVSATVDPSGDETTWQILASSAVEPDAGLAECQALAPLEFRVAKEGTIPLGEPGTVAIEETLTGLERSQTYCVRLVATNGGGAARADAVFTTKAVAPSDVKLAYAAPRTDVSARLNFYVNPEGEAPLTYRFEYSANGVTWTPLEEVSKTEARSQIVVAEEVSGLIPGTTYRYRLGLVKNAAGEVPVVPPGEEKTFTTRTAAEMALPANALGEPEKRGIELVNNPDKGNQNVFIPPKVDEIVSSDGNKAIWSVVGGAPGAFNGTQSSFLAERASGGWQSRSIVPPASEQVDGGGSVYELDGTTPDFSHFFFNVHRANVFNPITPGTRVRLDQDQNQDILRSYESKAPEVDMTDDGTHVVAINLSTRQLEEIGSGTPEVVSLLPPNQTPSSCGLDVTSGKSFIGGNNGSSPVGTGVEARAGYHMIATTDASRIYFGAQPNGECNQPFGLYVFNRETKKAKRIDRGAGADVAFIRAAPDGRAAYFATRSKLESADKNTDVDIYRWDEESEKSTCLTCVVADAGVEEETGSYNSIMVSDDFSHIYFVSAHQLVAGFGEAGVPSLYVLSQGEVRFIAELPVTNKTNSFRTLDEARLSSDGNFLTFIAEGTRHLTADEVEPASNGESKRQLYRYDYRDGSVECLSCSHDEITTRPVGDGESSGGVRLSSDGSTVAFTTFEALVPGDVNRGDDVYEWRNGVTRLVTDGITEFRTDPAVEPRVRGIDSTGANIFFTVADPGLTGFEQDGLANLYDARIGGGFEPPAQPARCSEDSCQGPLLVPPLASRSASSAYHGPGRSSSRRPACGRKKARQRHGHCSTKRHKRHQKKAVKAKRGGTK
jgi:hypothetical protein